MLTQRHALYPVLLFRPCARTKASTGDQSITGKQKASRSSDTTTSKGTSSTHLHAKSYVLFLDPKLSRHLHVRSESQPRCSTAMLLALIIQFESSHAVAQKRSTPELCCEEVAAMRMRPRAKFFSLSVSVGLLWGVSTALWCECRGLVVSGAAFCFDYATA